MTISGPHFRSPTGMVLGTRALSFFESFMLDLTRFTHLFHVCFSATLCFVYLFKFRSIFYSTLAILLVLCGLKFQIYFLISCDNLDSLRNLWTYSYFFSQTSALLFVLIFLTSLFFLLWISPSCESSKGRYFIVSSLFASQILLRNCVDFSQIISFQMISWVYYLF